MENVIEYQERVLREMEEQLEKEKQEKLRKQQEIIDTLKEQYKDVVCECNIPDESGNYEPCCAQGKCTAYYTEDSMSTCTCCGAEMFKENGLWFHHIQKEIPFEERTSQFVESN